MICNPEKTALKAFITATGILQSKTQSTNKTYDWITSYLITWRTIDKYRNFATIKFCADLQHIPSHRCPSIKFNKRLEHTNIIIDQT